MKVDSGLLQYPVRCMAGFYFPVDGKVTFGDWTEPYIMIAFSVAMKFTGMLRKNFPYLFFIFGHQAYT